MSSVSKVMDGVLHYRGICNNHAKCRLRVYAAPGRATIALTTELPDNRGTSIIRMVDRLAEHVWRFLERPSTGLIWIEHIPEERCPTGYVYEETFCLVRFQSSQGRFSEPSWLHISKADAEAAVGHCLDEPANWQQQLTDLPIHSLLCQAI